MQFGIIHSVHVSFKQLLCEHCGWPFLAMDEKDLFDSFPDVHCVFRQQVLPCVTRQAANGSNLSLYRVRLPKNLDLFLTVRQAATQRMRRLP